MTSTPDPDALSRQIFVRHREPGHVRFALPAELCSLPAASTIEAALRRQDGVYRVTIHAIDRKLSVFYDEHACDLPAVLTALGKIAAEFAIDPPTLEAGRDEWLARLNHALGRPA